MSTLLLRTNIDIESKEAEDNTLLLQVHPGINRKCQVNQTFNFLFEKKIGRNRQVHFYALIHGSRPGLKLPVFSRILQL